jgi:hypothetical protein
MESVNRTLAGVVEVEAHLLHFLSLSDPDVLSEMPPLQRAQALAALLLLARATSTLFTLYRVLSHCPSTVFCINMQLVVLNVGFVWFNCGFLFSYSEAGVCCNVCYKHYFIFFLSLNVLPFGIKIFLSFYGKRKKKKLIY